MEKAKKKVWSENQLKIINSNDRRILVSASAGSGKTTVMIRRILRLISDGVKISDMLVCTFTKASAADMRNKLYALMRERGLKSQLRDLANADICTIDSFCQKLVSKYFYVLGIDPQFEMLDENESAALKSEAIESAIEEFSADRVFASLVHILRKKRRNGTLKDAVSEIMDYYAVNAKMPTYEYSKGEVRDKLSEFVAKQENGVMQSVNALFSQIDEPEIYADVLAAMQSGGKTNGRIRNSKQNDAYKPCIKNIRSKVNDFNELKNEISELKDQSASQEYAHALIRVGERAIEIYRDEKRKRAVLDFADLEIYALKILQSDVVSEIRAKYKHVFVDEYQDVNPLQDLLIGLVAQEGNLFMVGDIKQSIYAFRGCDPDIFKEKYYRYSETGEGKLICLNTNYRSNKRIIEFVNSVFSRVMTKEFGGISYADNLMTAARQSEGFVKFHVVSGGESSEVGGVYSVKNHQKNAMSKAEAEAALVAHRVSALAKSEVDGKAVSFGDIAVLSRSMGSLESLIVQKLKEMNIPVTLSEDAYFLERPETGQLINYMRLIDNRLDDEVMAIAMLSPFGGFCEDELAEVRLSGSDPFCALVASAAQSNEKIKAFMDKLDRYTALSLTVGADELVDTVVSECGYFNYAYRLGDDAAETLDKFLEFLGGCSAKNSLRATLRYIDERNPFVSLKSEENAVKLMTIHKSKGLEFKFVLLVGLDDSFNLKDTKKPILVGDKIAMRVYDEHKAFASDLGFLVGEQIKKKQLEEELRILYVAMTRAEEGLELFASLSEKGDKADEVKAISLLPDMGDMSQCTGAIKWLAPQLLQARTYDVSEIEIESPISVPVYFAAADRENVKMLKDYFDFKRTPVAPVKGYVSMLAHSGPLDFTNYEDNDEAVVRNDNAIERGNAYHRAMEKIDFSQPDLSVLSQDDLALIDKDKLYVAAEKMSEFKGDVYKEQAFMIKLAANELGISGEGDVIVQGVIDLLVINGDTATIVDYKTGKIHSSLEEGYFKQVKMYSIAVERLLGKRVTKKCLYYFDAEKFVEIE